MCNRYYAPGEKEIEEYWFVGRQKPNRWWDDPQVRDIFPRYQAPFIRRAADDAGYSREAVVGRWGLIPWFSKTADIKYSTNNARSEELSAKDSYKHPWARGQRCIIPAQWFYEPYWGPYENQFKRCEWWQFRRADGQPWGLAGIWNAWIDKTTGERHESFSMLTMNADEHPLMKRMHRNELDAKTKQPLPLDQQDKRSVIPIELGDVDTWLAGTVEEASKLLRLAPVEDFDASPA